MLRRITNRNKVSVNTGTSQDSRVIPALDPGQFLIHEQDLEAFTHFLTTFAPLVTYYDEHNLPYGSWTDFFENDLIIKVIELQSFDPDEPSQEFAVLTERAKLQQRGTSVEALMEEGLRIIFGLLQKVEQLRWVSKELPELKKEVLNLIGDKFAPIREQCIAYLRGNMRGARGEGMLNEKIVLNFGQEWNIDTDESRTFVFSLDPELSQLNRIFSQLLDFIRLLQDRTARFLEILLHSGNVSPHIAMLFAIHQMTGIAGRDLNQFTGRHLNYYYRQVLHLKEQAGVPDKVHVVFDLAQNTQEYFLPEGTQLDAGEDATGVQRIYELDRNITLNKTRISAIKGIIHDEVAPDFPLLANSEYEIESYFVNSKLREDERPLEGGMQTFLPGLSIAAPLLHLDPADSLIKFKFNFESESFLRFRELIFAETWKFFGQPGPERLLSWRILKVNQLINDLLIVEYSGEGGEWITVDTNNVAFKLLSEGERLLFNVLELEVLLHPSDPAIHPCEMEEYPQAQKAGVPVFRFSLNPKLIHLYYTLVELVMERINIEVKVIDLRSLILQNDYGLLDPNSPFEPFGPMPRVGASFYLGHPRIFNHHLTQLRVNLEWFSVPTEPQGFAEYYQQYGGVDTNYDFKVEVSVLDQKQWKPRQGRQQVSLFESLPHAPGPGERKLNRVSKVTRIDHLDMSLLKMRPGSSVGNLIMYTHETLSGFLRLELNSPAMAFGHRAYPDILGRISTEAILKKRYVPQPNPPFVPTVKTVSLDYTASTSINFHKKDTTEHEYIYHRHPLGVDFLNPEFGLGQKRLLAHYPLGAHLFVGLDNYRSGQELSLLFEINESGALEYDEPLEVEWAYLREDQWVPLLPEEILYDTTVGMTRSGLIVMVLKEIPELKSEIMPEGILWLRCFSKFGNLFLRNVLDVHCQAASATFLDQDNDPAHYKKGLPAGSIVDLYPGNVNIESVSQPHPSFGGNAGEEGQAFFTRISERLRHKGRVVTAWDCETLVLTHFPQIQKVICLSHLDEGYGIAPGHLLVIVIPRVTQKDRELLRVPRVSPQTLSDITRYLEDVTSPFVRIHVRNAALEHVRVNMGVKFRKGYDDITYFKNKLNQEIFQFLMPWLFEEQADIQPGQPIYASKIIRFLDSREYIDYIANFSLFHFVDGTLIPPKAAGMAKQVARPSAPGAVLLSVPQHHFDLISESGVPLEGIGLFAAGVDLTIPEDNTQYGSGINQQKIMRDFAIPDEKVVPGQNISIKIKWR